MQRVHVWYLYCEKRHAEHAVLSVILAVATHAAYVCGCGVPRGGCNVARSQPGTLSPTYAFGLMTNPRNIQSMRLRARSPVRLLCSVAAEPLVRGTVMYRGGALLYRGGALLCRGGVLAVVAAWGGSGLRGRGERVCCSFAAVSRLGLARAMLRCATTMSRGSAQLRGTLGPSIGASP